MKDRLVKDITAVLAKKKGFKPEKPTTDYVDGFIGEWNDEDVIIGYYECEIQEEDWVREDYFLRPTLSLLRRWLINQNIHISIYPLTDKKEMYGWRINVYEIFPHKEIYRDNSNKYLPFENYDDAVEVGIIEALKSMKDDN